MDVDLLKFVGWVTTPSVSSTGSARMYFDPITGKLLCSEDGGAYEDCVGGGGVSYVGVIGSLPGSPEDGDLAVVTDGADADDCTSGSGSTYNVCVYNDGASAWQIVGDGTSVGGGNSIYFENQGSAEGNNLSSDITLDATDGLDLTCTGQDCTIKADSIDISRDTNLSADAPIQLTGDTINLATVDISDKTNLATSLPVQLTGDTINLATIDISSHTNLAAGTDITLTGDTLSVDSTVTRDTEWDTAAEINAATTDDDFATLTGSQTLTNKTINTVSNTITILEADISDLGSYLENVVEDTTPQLGGALDAQSNNITAINYIDLDSISAPTHAEGIIYYDSTQKSLSYYNEDSDISNQIGRENWIRVYNNSGSTITNGQVVYVSGKEDTEDRLTIDLAQADADSTSRVLGFATHDIENTTFGYVTQFGYVNNLDTSSFSDGEPIWLSPDTAGGITNVEPQSPNNTVFLGFISDSHASTGNIFITALGNTSGENLVTSATEITVPARKGSVGTINKGQLVYISGYNTGQNAVEVELADADGSGTFPALGVANESITNSATGDLIVVGRVANINTAAYSVNDSLYLSTTAGAFTSTRPTGASDCIQKVANVLRSSTTVGVIQIVGAGRCNDESNSIDPDWLAGDTTDDNLVDTAILNGTGADTTVVTGTAGTNGNCAKWNVDGDLVDAGAACGSGGTIDISDGTNLSASLPVQLVGDTVSLATIDISDNTNLAAGTNITLSGDTLNVDDVFVLTSGDTMSGDLNVPNEVYGVGWNGSNEVPTKDALYDKIETITGGGTVDISDGTNLSADLPIQLTGDTITLATIDISSNTNLVAGTNITLSGDTLEVDDVFIMNTGDTVTGDFDFSGANVELPNAGSLPGSCTNDGEIFVNTAATSGQQVYVCESGTYVLQGDGNSGSATAWDDIADPDAEATIQFTSFEQTITTTLDDATAGIEAALTLQNTDTALSNENTLIDLIHGDNTNTVGNFIAMYDNAGSNLKMRLGPTGDGSSYFSLFNTDTIVTNDTPFINMEVSDTDDENNIFLLGKDSGGNNLFELRHWGDSSSDADNHLFYLKNEDTSITNDQVAIEVEYYEENNDTNIVYMRFRSDGDGSITTDYQFDADGSVILGGVAYSLPSSDGTSGQQLTTDGAGVLTFEDAGSFSGSIDISDQSNLSASLPVQLVGDTVSLATIDISDNTNLSGGTNITLSGDTLNVDDSFILNTGDTATGDFDFSGATFEAPNSTTLPGSCSAGQIYIDTDATSGQQFYVCESGTFVLQGDGTTTPGSVDISDDTNLSAGTNITLTGDTLNVDDAFILNTGDTVTGDYDFSGATFELPNGTSPTVNAEGQTAWDTDDDAIAIYDGADEVRLHTKNEIIYWGFIDGDGSAITADSGVAQACKRIPKNSVVTAWYVNADQSGSVTIDIYKDTTYPPTDADSISSTEKITLSTATNNSDTSLTAMTTDWNAGDWVCYDVETATTVQWVSFDIYGYYD